MLWFSLSLLTALTVATSDAWVKRFFSNYTAYDMLTYPLLYSLPLLIISIFFVSIPDLDSTFYLAFAVSLPVNAVAFLIYMTAIKVSPLSLTVPYLAFTPTFMILTGSVFLNESPNIWGVFGIVATCSGSYVLNLDKENRSVWAPFKAIGNERGSWLMMTCAFIFSFTAVIGKLAMLHSSTLFFTVSFFLSFNLCLPAVLLLAGKISWRTFLENRLQGCVAGVLLYVHIISHCYAIMLTKAAYMISIKRLSVLFSVIYGGLVFQEENIMQRFLGTLLMFGGSVLILLKG